MILMLVVFIKTMLQCNTVNLCFAFNNSTVVGNSRLLCSVDVNLSGFRENCFPLSHLCRKPIYLFAILDLELILFMCFKLL